MNYYLIPVVDSCVYYNLKSLKDNLKEKSLLLYERELKKLDILYESSSQKKSSLEVEYNNYLLDTKRLYIEKNIPQYIVARGNLYSIREVVTGIKIISSSKVNLEMNEISKNMALEYLEDNCSYNDSVNNFFDVKICSNKKVRKIKK